MGFKEPDLGQIYDALDKIMVEIASPYNDGFTSSHCKHNLYMLKCWLDREYSKLPIFAGEEKWEHEQIINILKEP